MNEFGQPINGTIKTKEWLKLNMSKDDMLTYMFWMLVVCIMLLLLLVILTSV